MLTTVEAVTPTLAITLEALELCTILPTAKELSITVWGNMNRKGTDSDTNRNHTQQLWKNKEIDSRKVKTISILNSREKWVSSRTTSTWWIEDSQSQRKKCKWMAKCTKIPSLKCNWRTRSLCTVLKRNLSREHSAMMNIWTLIWVFLEVWTPFPKNKWLALSPWTTLNILRIDSRSKSTSDYSNG